MILSTTFQAFLITLTRTFMLLQDECLLLPCLPTRSQLTKVRRSGRESCRDRSNCEFRISPHCTIPLKCLADTVCYDIDAWALAPSAVYYSFSEVFQHFTASFPVLKKSLDLIHCHGDLVHSYFYSNESSRSSLSKNKPT